MCPPFLAGKYIDTDVFFVDLCVAMKKLTKGMCWQVSIIKDRVNKVGIAIFKKPESNECYVKRSETQPEICPDSDDPNAAWYFLPLNLDIGSVLTGSLKGKKKKKKMKSLALS